jgi:8-oxo-dGTP pyrophosphatase MutT (NUDIX family)
MRWIITSGCVNEEAENHGPCLGVIVHVIRGRGEDGRILFLERSGGRFEGQWWPVAGTCEPGEAAIDTVLRELPEETGLTPLAVYSFGPPHPHPEQEGHLAIFVAPVPDDAQVVLNWEHDDSIWLSLEQAIEFVPPEMESLIDDIGRGFFFGSPQGELRVWPTEPVSPTGGGAP